jgi:hypothetical protein
MVYFSQLGTSFQLLLRYLKPSHAAVTTAILNRFAIPDVQSDVYWRDFINYTSQITTQLYIHPLSEWLSSSALSEFPSATLLHAVLSTK